MCETNFLQTCPFSINLTPLYSLNLSFPLLFYVTSTAILSTLILCILTLIFHFFCISTQISRIPTLIPRKRSHPIPRIPTLFSAFPSFVLQFLILGVPDNLFSL